MSALTTSPVTALSTSPVTALSTTFTQRPATAGRRATVLAEAVVSNYLREISPARPRRAETSQPRRHAEASQPRLAAQDVNNRVELLPTACAAALRVRQPARHTLHGVRLRRGLTVSDPAQAA